jgi:hypothetical protein
MGGTAPTPEEAETIMAEERARKAAKANAKSGGAQSAPSPEQESEVPAADALGDEAPVSDQ